MNKKNITIKGTKDTVLAGNAGESLMSVLNSRPDMNYTFPCGGNGRCGKCVIQVLEGCFDITDADRKFFSREKLDEGYRLACKAILKDDCVIEYKGTLEKSYDIQSAFVDVETDNEKGLSLSKSTDTKHIKYGIAIDIGTTTIAMSLVDADSKKVLYTFTMLNHQRKFGADVIARIQASNEGKGAELRASIVKDLMEGIKKLLDDTNTDACKLEEIVIAGNTTMGHLLLGYPCDSLGVYPFTPVDISGKVLEFGEVFCFEGESVVQQSGAESDANSRDNTLELNELKGVLVYFVPGISTYVGADITSGIFHCKMAEKESVSLLIDLGTNGEMAIGNRDKLLVTSTAAGPAFEGGNISCGTGSIDGAVCDITISGDDIKLKTINDAPVAGICGTGVIAITAELLENELVDETGRFEDEYFDEGFVLGTTDKGEVISFTQKDVREIQLAKSAIRAGIETLILRYGIEKSEIADVYLAGGFGYHIDLKKAAKIGLLPEEFIDRTKAVGNSSLGGAVYAINNEDNKEKLKKICTMAEEISLSDDRDFQEFYMDYMMFEDEE